jgi:hypothetical protein
MLAFRLVGWTLSSILLGKSKDAIFNEETSTHMGLWLLPNIPARHLAAIATVPLVIGGVWRWRSWEL